MNNTEQLCFSQLFKDACLECFGHAITGPLTETESKIFCNRVLEKTGLSIGWKSVKNYSFFVMDDGSRREENPSTATLDTLARYVLHAPYTSEIKRKDNEGHYPYWFLYRKKFQLPVKKQMPKRWLVGGLVFLVGIIIIIALTTFMHHVTTQKAAQFTDEFHKVDKSAISKNGWFVRSKDAEFWNKRNERPGALSLFTLKGDNWPDPSAKPDIKNLLLRSINANCFTAEVHLDNFVPSQKWQQAGILLLEDTTFTGKSIRLSLAYNDLFGGYARPREVYIQAITSLGNGFGKPEEIAHKPVLYLDSVKNNPELIKNLQNSALRIEKHGNKFRFLYAGGASANGAFKEVVTQDFDIHPKYIGIFAIAGFVDAAAIPARFTFFRLTDDGCD